MYDDDVRWHGAAGLIRFSQCKKRCSFAKHGRHCAVVPALLVIVVVVVALQSFVALPRMAPLASCVPHCHIEQERESQECMNVLPLVQSHWKSPLSRHIRSNRRAIASNRSQQLHNVNECERANTPVDVSAHVCVCVCWALITIIILYGMVNEVYTLVLYVYAMLK